MERLTSNKPTSDMSMIELAHNSCYADENRNARYRDYNGEMDARDFARILMARLTKDRLPEEDEEFDEEILEDLTIDPSDDVRGLIVLFYRNLFAMADLRENLKYFEDLEEQGRLLKLPCKVGDTVYGISMGKIISLTVNEFSIFCLKGEEIINAKCQNGDEFRNYVEREFGKTVFLAIEEAEEKLKELRGGENDRETEICN